MAIGDRGSKLRVHEGQQPCILTKEQRAICIKAARMGLSLTAVAHKVKRSRAWLTKAREQHPDFDAELMYALQEYEAELTRGITGALKRKEADTARAFLAVRTNRFPGRHGNDPKLRFAHETAMEERLEDMGVVKVQDQGGMNDQDRELLRAFLDVEMARRDRQ